MTRLEQIRSLARDCTDQERATIVFKLMNAEWGTYGDELDEMFHDAVLRRVAGRVTIASSGCWECSYAKDTSGYPQVSYLSRMELTHRAMFVAAKGVIPTALQLDHLCRNRACCNPAHLEAVSPRENGLRGETIQARNASVTHCPQGHAYGPDNAFPSDLKRGKGRRCRACHLARDRARQRSAA